MLGAALRLQESEAGLVSQRLWRLPTFLGIGVPEPDAEMASGEAVGQPLERVARREREDRGDDPASPKKKQKSGARRAKRDAEADIEELCRQICRRSCR